MPGDDDLYYILARGILLDALDALRDHLNAVILVGAQAVYLHTEHVRLQTRPRTTDADLALDPAVLGMEPAIETAMQAAGFLQPDQPGQWVGEREGVQVTVDLMVPAAVGGVGRRAARLKGHAEKAARKAKGLEGALVDHQTKLVTALEVVDTRQAQIEVAGPTALLVAKLHKIAERAGNPRRQEAKDALDMYRLLATFDAESLGARFSILCQDPRSCDVTKEAIGFLGSLFDSDSALGPRLAAQEVEFRDDPDVIAQSLAALAQDLFTEIERLREA